MIPCWTYIHCSSHCLGVAGQRQLCEHNCRRFLFTNTASPAKAGGVIHRQRDNRPCNGSFLCLSASKCQVIPIRHWHCYFFSWTVPVLVLEFLRQLGWGGGPNIFFSEEPHEMKKKSCWGGRAVHSSPKPC